MYINTKYEIGDVVALLYHIATPSGGPTSAIVPGKIKKLTIGEMVDDEGDTVTTTEYGVVLSSVGGFVNTFDESQILCEISGYETLYLERLAREAGFVTIKVGCDIRMAERAKEEAEEDPNLNEAVVSPGGTGDPE